MQTHSANHKTLYFNHARKPTGRYHLLPLLIIGMLILAITLAVTTVTYSLLCYYNDADGNCSAKASLFIYLFSLFIACFLVSFIIRGKSPKPAFIIGGAYYIFGLIMLAKANGWASLTVGGTFEKLLFTLLAVFAAYIAAFIICFIRSSLKAKRFRKNIN